MSTAMSIFILINVFKDPYYYKSFTAFYLVVLQLVSASLVYMAVIVYLGSATGTFIDAVGLRKNFFKL